MKAREDFRHTYVSESAKNIKPEREDINPVVGFVLIIAVMFFCGAVLAAIEVKSFVDRQNARIEQSLY